MTNETTGTMIGQYAMNPDGDMLTLFRLASGEVRAYRVPHGAELRIPVRNQAVNCLVIDLNHIEPLQHRINWVQSALDWAEHFDDYGNPPEFSEVTPEGIGVVFFDPPENGAEA
jgi:hypothetical protein